MRYTPVYGFAKPDPDDYVDSKWFSDQADAAEAGAIAARDQQQAIADQGRADVRRALADALDLTEWDDLLVLGT